MALLDSKQTVDLNVEAKEPIQVKIELGEKMVFTTVIVATLFFVAMIKKAKAKAK